MAIKCGKCSKRHATTDDVRRCFAGEQVDVVVEVHEPSPWPASEKQIAYIVGLQAQRALPDEYDMKDEAALARLDKDEASRLIQELKALPYKSPKGAGTVTDDAKVTPAGRYALKGEDDVWRFFEVQDGKGRWEGYKFIKQLIGSPGAYRKEPMQQSRRMQVQNDIAIDVKKAAIDYGLQSGVCGVCGSPLSNPESLAKGIGPKCAAKRGW